MEVQDYPSMYRELRESFLRLQRKNANLDLVVTRLHVALRHIMEDTTDSEAAAIAREALRSELMYNHDI